MDGGENDNELDDNDEDNNEVLFSFNFPLFWNIIAFLLITKILIMKGDNNENVDDNHNVDDNEVCVIDLDNNEVDFAAALNSFTN